MAQTVLMRWLVHMRGREFLAVHAGNSVTQIVIMSCYKVALFTVRCVGNVESCPVPIAAAG